ncbi:MAG: ferritin-like domain-containing protein, partial [Sphingomonadales bacterium]|nr:ferritin-like domain-containing protein [Sphingomonadales bacterium]
MSDIKFADLYTVDPGDMKWEIPQDFDNIFDFSYSDEKHDLLNLYEKGKRMQWNASDRIDWSLELDEDNPVGLPEELFALYGYEPYMKMPDKEKARVRRHFQAWNNSQFLHGEQGALICASKIVQQVPNMEAKFYAATQVIDEARHVEA